MGRPKKQKEDGDSEVAITEDNNTLKSNSTEKSLSGESGESADSFTMNLASALKSQVIKEQFGSILTEHSHQILKPLIQQEVTSQLTPIHEKFEGLEMELTTMISHNTKDVKVYANKMDEIQTRLLAIERAHKASNIIIIGLPEVPPVPNNDSSVVSTDDVAASSTPESRIQNRLILHIIDFLTRAGMSDICPAQFDSVTTIKSQGASNRLLVRMKQERYKINIYKQKKLLKNLPQKIYLNEDLTKEDDKIFRKTRQHVKEGIIYSAWTKGGVVYAKTTPDSTPYAVTEL
jgi:hypothetical protein